MFKLKNLVKQNNVRLLVFDMAGTTVDEGGIVYQTLFDTFKQYRVNVNKEDIYKWHGRNKNEVLSEYLHKRKSLEGHEEFPIIEKGLHDSFEKNLRERYFTSSSIKLIDDNMPELFNNIRKKDIKIALNTGYSKSIQESIIKKLNMNEFIDTYISSEEVKYGRPYPYMIYKLMEKYEIDNPLKVVKFGDTRNDILEGINARCWSVGVLSGADGKNKLSEADVIINSVMDMDI
tara:strand:- start:3306 stop:4001 length:696 start_codon:yes stop_codon:yes gene_type:complete